MCVLSTSLHKATGVRIRDRVVYSHMYAISAWFMAHLDHVCVVWLQGKGLELTGTLLLSGKLCFFTIW